MPIAGAALSCEQAQPDFPWSQPRPRADASWGERRVAKLTSMTAAVRGGTASSWTSTPRTFSNHASTVDQGQTLIPPPTTPTGGGKPPGPRLPSTSSRTDSLARSTRCAMSLTDTRSWSTHTGTAVGTALVDALDQSRHCRRRTWGADRCLHRREGAGLGEDSVGEHPGYETTRGVVDAIEDHTNFVGARHQMGLGLRTWGIKVLGSRSKSSERCTGPPTQPRGRCGTGPSGWRKGRGTMGPVTELHVRVPDEVAARLASEAAERGVSAEDIAAEVLAGHSPAPVTATELAFIGMGHSGRGDLSERVKEIRQASFGS